MFGWLKLTQRTVPGDPYTFDLLFSEYIEECWEEGEGRQFLLDTKCGLCFRFRPLQARLTQSADLLRAWKKLSYQRGHRPCPFMCWLRWPGWRSIGNGTT